MAMMPLYQLGAFDYPTAMALATVIGILFGFVLERAGFGRATVLVAQFYGDDMRVLKVMFTAIATTTVGLGLLAGLGVVQLGALVIPETWIGPHIFGGLLLGVGFAISGYCPGTALVAIGTGFLDGVFALGGIMMGSLLFGWVYPSIEGLYFQGGRGRVLFPEAWGVPWPVLALGVTLMAIGAFLAGEKAERYFSAKHGIESPPANRPTRNRVFGGLLAFSLAGLVTLSLPAAAPPPVEAFQPPAIEALELANLLVQRGESLYLVDLRDPATCAKERIPGAICLPNNDGEAAFLGDLPVTRTLVLYGEEGMDLPSGASNYLGSSRVLKGGYPAFRQAILTEPTPPTAISPTSLGQYRTQMALYQHFTGTQSSAAPVVFKPQAIKRKVKKGGGC